MLKIDNNEVREKQISKLQQIRASRDSESVEKILDALTKAAERGEGNLLELSVEAAKLRATVGEISYAIEKVAGRHKA